MKRNMKVEEMEILQKTKRKRGESEKEENMERGKLIGKK